MKGMSCQKDRKGKAGGCGVFNKVLCNALRHISVIDNHINRKMQHSKTREVLETRLLTLNSCLKQTILSHFNFISNSLFMNVVYINCSLE